MQYQSKAIKRYCPSALRRRSARKIKGCPRMGILDQITQMKREGMEDGDIIRNLQEQGISPRQINDALNQAQIKDAVNDSGMNIPSIESSMPPAPMESTQDYYDYGQQAPQEYSDQAPDYQSQDYNPNYGAQQDYPQQSYSDTIIEISEQVFLQKSKNMQKQLDENNEFIKPAKTQLENLNARLKRVEETIDKLQIAILDRVGSYQDTLGSIKKEMSMMQDSFGKLVDYKVKNSERKEERETSQKKSKK